MKEFEICRRRTHEEEVAVRRAQRNRQIREYVNDDLERLMRQLGAFQYGPLSVSLRTEAELPGMWTAADFTGGETDVA